METTRVAINGLGRIGRAFLKLALRRPELEVVAVNDLGDIANMAYLLSHDSVYRSDKSDTSNWTYRTDRSYLEADGFALRYLSEKAPAKLPWKELDIDVVVESTGFFASYEKAKAHLEAGAKRVVITAPVKDFDSPFPKGSPPEPSPTKSFWRGLESFSRAGTREGEGFESSGPADSATSFNKGGTRAATVLVGINEEKLKSCQISSNASCTTNAAAPVIVILDEAIGIEKAVLNTVHAYTATQSLVDSPAMKKGMREGRAAAQNIVPSSTGAAIAMTKAYPALAGKFDGISLRVPVLCGSIADITFIAKRPTTREEVNDVLRKAAKEKRWQGIFSASDDELVSSDIIGNTSGAIAELSMTRVVGLPAAGAAQAGGNLVKVLAWYDNEMGYANTLVAHVIKAGEQLK